MVEEAFEDLDKWFFRPVGDSSAIDGKELWSFHGDFKNLPDHGWKIHIPFPIFELENRYPRVLSLLEQSDVAFKFIPTMRKYLQLCGKSANRLQSGKVVTIYPENWDRLVYIIDMLSPLVRGMETQRVLTDKRYSSELPFFIRYGSFKELSKISNEGEVIHLISSGESDTIEDKRMVGGQSSPFVSDKVESDFVRPKEFLLKNISIAGAIRFSNSGGIYVGKLEDGSNVVVKEGRGLTGYTLDQRDGKQRLECEAEFTQLVSQKVPGFAPEIIDSFSYGANFYLVLEEIVGDDLSEWIAKHNPFYLSGVQDSESEVENYLDRCGRIVRQLRDFVDGIRSHGLVHGDLSLTNVIISNEETVRIVDYEAMSVIPLGKNLLRTPDMFPSRKEILLTGSQVDEYAYHAIVVSLIHRSTKLLEHNSNWGTWLRNYVRGIAGFVPEWVEESLLYFENLYCGVAEGPISLSRDVGSAKKELECLLFRSVIEDIYKKSAERDLEHTYNHKELSFAEGISGKIFACSRSSCISSLELDKLRGIFVERVMLSSVLSRLPGSLSYGKAGILVCAVALSVDIKHVEVLYKDVLQSLGGFEDDSFYYGKAGAVFSLWYAKRSYKQLPSVPAELMTLNWRKYRGKNGLLYGGAGIAFVSWLAGLAASNSEDLITLGTDLNYLTEYKGKLLLQSSNTDKRLLPYIGTGASGCLLLIDLISKQDKRYRTLNEDIFALLKESLDINVSIDPGLLEGLWGIAVVRELLQISDIDLSPEKSALLNLIVVGPESSVATINPRNLEFDYSFHYGVSGILFGLTLLNCPQTKTILDWKI